MQKRPRYRSCILKELYLNFSKLSFSIRFNLLHPQPFLFLFVSESLLWCFSSFANYYFQVSQNFIGNLGRKRNDSKYSSFNQNPLVNMESCKLSESIHNEKVMLKTYILSMQYSKLPISQTLDFSKLSILEPKVVFLPQPNTTFFRSFSRTP